MEISVVIPTYNDEDTVSRAIQSALSQTLDNIEVIVVNDASTDATLKRIKQFSNDIDIYNHETNKGGGSARNTGIKHASGEYIAFLDADDEWLPTKLEKQLEDLETRSAEWIASYCDHRRESPGKSRIHSLLAKKFGGEDTKTRMEGGEEIIPEILTMKFNTGGSSTLFIKRDIIKKVNGFDETFPRHQDLELLVRILRNGKIAYLNKKLVVRHSTGVPDPEKVHDAKKIFFTKFEEEINILESRGVDVHGIHHGKLAQRYYHHGRIREGTRHLLKANFGNRTDILRVFRDLVVGLSREVRRRIRWR